MQQLPPPHDAVGPVGRARLLADRCLGHILDQRAADLRRLQNASNLAEQEEAQEAFDAINTIQNEFLGRVALAEAEPRLEVPPLLGRDEFADDPAEALEEALEELAEQHTFLDAQAEGEWQLRTSFHISEAIHHAELALAREHARRPNVQVARLMGEVTRLTDEANRVARAGEIDLAPDISLRCYLGQHFVYEDHRFALGLEFGVDRINGGVRPMVGLRTELRPALKHCSVPLQDGRGSHLGLEVRHPGLARCNSFAHKLELGRTTTESYQDVSTRWTLPLRKVPGLGHVLPNAVQVGAGRLTRGGTPILTPVRDWLQRTGVSRLGSESMPSTLYAQLALGTTPTRVLGHLPQPFRDVGVQAHGLGVVQLNRVVGSNDPIAQPRPGAIYKPRPALRGGATDPQRQFQNALRPLQGSLAGYGTNLNATSPDSCRLCVILARPPRPGVPPAIAGLSRGQGTLSALSLLGLLLVGRVLAVMRARCGGSSDHNADL